MKTETDLAGENRRLREALQSIAANTCCDGCGEVAKWAQAALSGELVPYQGLSNLPPKQMTAHSGIAIGIGECGDVARIGAEIGEPKGFKAAPLRNEHSPSGEPVPPAESIKLNVPVYVENEQFTGYGIAQYDTGLRKRAIGVLLENGNTWEYDAATVRNALPDEYHKMPRVIQAAPPVPPASACPKCGTKMIWREPHVLKTYGNWECIVCVPPSAVSPQDREEK